MRYMEYHIKKNITHADNLLDISITIDDVSS